MCSAVTIRTSALRATARSIPTTKRCRRGAASIAWRAGYTRDASRGRDDDAAGRGVREVARLKSNEVIYKAQIKNLHRLLGMMVHRIPGTAAYSEARAEAARSCSPPT